MINFTKNYLDYGYGLIEVFRKIFFEQNAESISWMAHKHNPAKYSYKKLCLAFQGKIKSTPTAVYYTITRNKIDKIFTNIKKEK